MQSTQNQVTDPVMTPAQTLRDAAAYLAEHGWIQGSYYDMSATVFTPAACGAGAIAIVCYGGPVEAPAQMYGDPGYPAWDDAMRVLELYLFLEHGFDSAYEFNDAKGRNRDQVVGVLWAAAADPCITGYVVPYTVTAAGIAASAAGGAS